MFIFKNEFSYDNILSPSEVKEKGILFDNERFTYESYWENGFNHYERLFYTDENNVKAPFSGLCYNLYPNGNIWGYSYYNGGYEEGEHVDFYDNGAISEYTNFNKTESRALTITWSKDGTISKIEEMFNVGNFQKRIEYDESGNIIHQYYMGEKFSELCCYEFLSSAESHNRKKSDKSMETSEMQEEFLNQQNKLRSRIIFTPILEITEFAEIRLLLLPHLRC